MNSYGRPIKRLPRKGLACQCKQDLFWFFWGCSVYIRGQLLGGGNVREAHISDTQQLSEVCKHYSQKKSNTNRVKDCQAKIPFVVKSKLVDHMRFCAFSISYLVLTKFLLLGNFPHTCHMPKTSTFHIRHRTLSICFIFIISKMWVLVAAWHIIEN